MFLNSRFQLMTIAAAGALVVLTAANAPARALEPISHLGPVGPYEPILATVGSKRVIAFYVPDSGRCSINAVVFDSASPEAPYSASRVRINLWPGEAFALDGTQQKSIDLRCGENAATLGPERPRRAHQRRRHEQLTQLICSISSRHSSTGGWQSD
jgi:hypothetical protein